MKSLAPGLFLVAALLAQVAPPGEPGPTTVVAKIDGRDITAGEIQEIMRTWSPDLVQKFQQDPIRSLQQIYMAKALAAEGEKLHLDQDQIWKEQIAAAREQILATARATYEHDHFPVSEEDIKAFYERNKMRYEISKIRIIKIGLLEPMPIGTSQADIQRAAQTAVQNSHVPHSRSEADAKTLAGDVLKQFRAGADFAELVKKYSEDEESKAKGGDYGTVSQTSNLPEEIKKAVFALKPGEVSEPVRQANALVIIRVEERSAPPVEKLNSDIITEIRNQHLQVFGQELGKRFTPKILRPEFFLPSGQPPQRPKP